MERLELDDSNTLVKYRVTAFLRQKDEERRLAEELLAEQKELEEAENNENTAEE